MADLGNYNLNKSTYKYTAPDPNKSAMKGLMNTDYDQLKKDLQTPGDLQINKTFDKADYTTRDVMGGNGMYGSSIHSDQIGTNADNRANALSSNAAQAGANVAQLKSSDNQWLGNASLDEARMQNTWNLGQDQLQKGLMHDILMGSLNNQWNQQSINNQGKWGIDSQESANNANESAAMWGGLGSLAGGLMSMYA